MQISFQKLLSEAKADLFTEAVQFIKSKVSVIQRLLSKEHHQFISQFLEFKTEMQPKLEEMRYLRERFVDTEVAYATLSPAMEATYGLGSSSVLRLFDCLIPRICEAAKYRHGFSD